MKSFLSPSFLLAVVLPLFLAIGCSRNAEQPTASPDSAKPHKHEHKPPHGGTPVVLGKEIYHLEFVLDPDTGKFQAYVLDGEMENFVRSPMATLEVVADVAGKPQTLTLNAVSNPATGETVGDTALFETQASWLKVTREFDAVLRSITIRGSTFTDVKFNFPKGNDTD
jgi:hypothetical protein